MVHKARTADERFIIFAYKTAIALGDYTTPLNRYEVGKLAGVNEKGVDAICKLLIQANFIKKDNADDFYLTSNGEQLAIRLLNE